MLNCYFTLIANIKLQEDVHFKKVFSFLSTFLNECLLEDKYLKELHLKKEIKGYSLSCFTPIETDKIYKKGETYKFNIKTFDFELATRLRDAVGKNQYIENVSIKINEMQSIKKIKSTTPCITTMEEERFWRVSKNSIASLYEQLDKNIKHKANLFYGYDKEYLNTSPNFIESLEIINNKDIVVDYKFGKIVGYSIEIIPKQDDLSQKLANICLINGIGEKNSLGFGYCIQKINDKEKKG